MKKFSTRIAAGAGVAAVSIPLMTSAALAATVSPGDEIRVDHGKSYTKCSVSHAGGSAQGDLAFTAGHCVKKGDVVTDAHGNRIGTVIYSNHNADSDYAVIKLDEGVTPRAGAITSIATPTDAHGLNFDNFGRIVVKKGATTGTTYGVGLAGVDRKTYSLVYSDRGDSGGAVYDLSGKHIGTVSGGPAGPFFQFITITSNTGNDVDEFNHTTGANYMPAGTSGVPTKPEAPEAPSIPEGNVDNFMRALPATPRADIGEALGGVPGSSATPAVRQPAVPVAPQVDRYAAVAQDAVKATEPLMHGDFASKPVTTQANDIRSAVTAITGSARTHVPESTPLANAIDGALNAVEVPAIG